MSESRDLHLRERWSSWARAMLFYHPVGRRRTVSDHLDDHGSQPSIVACAVVAGGVEADAGSAAAISVEITDGPLWSNIEVGDGRVPGLPLWLPTSRWARAGAAAALLTWQVGTDRDWGGVP